MCSATLKRYNGEAELKVYVSVFEARRDGWLLETEPPRSRIDTWVLLASYGNSRIYEIDVGHCSLILLPGAGLRPNPKGFPQGCCPSSIGSRCCGTSLCSRQWEDFKWRQRSAPVGVSSKSCILMYSA